MRTFKLMIVFALAFGFTACATDDTNCGMTENCNTPPDTCGDGTCQADMGEDAQNCPEDCEEGLTCGDGVCSLIDGETVESCPADCTDDGVCGDGVCSSADHEDRFTCTADCPIGLCGNNDCEDGETAQNCPNDCGP